MNQYSEFFERLIGLLQVKRKTFHTALPHCSQVEFYNVLRGKCRYKKATRRAVVNQVQDYADRLFFLKEMEQLEKVATEPGFARSPLFDGFTWTFEPEEILKPQELAAIINQARNEADQIAFAGLHPFPDGGVSTPASSRSRTKTSPKPSRRR